MKATDLSSEERKKLLAIIRHAVFQAVGGKPDGEPPQLLSDMPSNGAFVTLHIDHRLRGCIGTFASAESIVQCVKEMAAAAALRDPRFPSVSPAELDQIDIEVSLLTPLEEMDPQEIEVGRHGICIERGFHRGVLLPQVAVENGWGRETFLCQTCQKAGLPLDAWNDKDTKIEVFEAVVFGEKSEGLR